MLNIAVLVSGGGTNLQALLDSEARGENPNGRITLVVASKPGVYALERAAKAGVEGCVVRRKDYASSEDFDAALLKTLKDHNIDLVVLAGFLSVLGPSVIEAYPRRILNVHPALIPSFCGPGMYGLRPHEAALARGCKVTGATVHFVNEECDGGPILLQKAVDILPGDTPEVLQKRVMEQAEWKLLPKAVAMICNGEVEEKLLLSRLTACHLPQGGRQGSLSEGAVAAGDWGSSVIGEFDMEKINLNEYLASNEYPGRGIAVAMAPDGRQMFIGYFIMGRSENSRNRVFDPVPERGGICTIAADPAKLEDPSLIIYNPVLTLGKTHIVTNGDQTDTIYDLMSQGKSFADALRTRTFEPDGPNYTPRISAVVYADGSYQMSILKSADGNGDSVQRYFFDYPQPVAGEGHFISTYKHNGNAIPSFEGEPLRFACPRTIGDFAQGLWSSLNPDNKVSLFARVIDLDSGETGDMIFNKYDAVCSDLDDPEEPELLPEELELLKKLDAEEKQD